MFPPSVMCDPVRLRPTDGGGESFLPAGGVEEFGLGQRRLRALGGGRGRAGEVAGLGHSLVRGGGAEVDLDQRRGRAGSRLREQRRGDRVGAQGLLAAFATSAASEATSTAASAISSGTSAARSSASEVRLASAVLRFRAGWRRLGVGIHVRWASGATRSRSMFAWAAAPFASGHSPRDAPAAIATSPAAIASVIAAQYPAPGIGSGDATSARNSRSRRSSSRGQRPASRRGTTAGSSAARVALRLGDPRRLLARSATASSSRPAARITSACASSVSAWRQSQSVCRTIRSARSAVSSASSRPALGGQQLRAHREPWRADARVAARPLVLDALAASPGLVVAALGVERLGERHGRLTERAVQPHLDQHVPALAQRALGGLRIAGGELEPAEAALRPLRHVAQPELLADRGRLGERLARLVEAPPSPFRDARARAACPPPSRASPLAGPRPVLVGETRSRRSSGAGPSSRHMPIANEIAFQFLGSAAGSACASARSSACWPSLARPWYMRASPTSRHASARPRSSPVCSSSPIACSVSATISWP